MDGRACGARGKEWGAGASPVAQSCALSCLSQISAFCALPRAALVFAHACGSLWASGPSAHRAHASLRHAHGFAAPLRVALGLRPKCPQGTRFPARLPGFGADSRSLNRRGGRWPRPPLVSLPRKYRRSVRWPRTALVFAHAFRSLWASGPSAHRAHASFRRTSRSLWASGPTAHRADAPLRCPKNLCRSTKRERCERPKGARNAAHPTFPKVPRTPLRLHQKKPPAPAQAGTGGHKARRINQANGFSVGYGSDAGRL